MIIVGISGKRGTGKTLLATILNKKYGFVDIPFAAELKSKVRSDFGLTIEHTDGYLKETPTEFNATPRDMMIKYGQFFRQFDPMYWVKKTFDKIQNVSTFYSGNKTDLRFVVSDVRFQNEANFIKSKGGILLRLERKPELNIYKTVSTDVSETDLDNYTRFDYVLGEDFNINPSSLEGFATSIMDSVTSQVRV